MFLCVCGAVRRHSSWVLCEQSWRGEEMDCWSPSLFSLALLLLFFPSLMFEAWIQSLNSGKTTEGWQVRAYHFNAFLICQHCLIKVRSPNSYSVVTMPKMGHLKAKTRTWNGKIPVVFVISLSASFPGIPPLLLPHNGKNVGCPQKTREAIHDYFQYFLE